MLIYEYIAKILTQLKSKLYNDAKKGVLGKN
jgi:hypothetical protein